MTSRCLLLFSVTEDTVRPMTHLIVAKVTCARKLVQVPDDTRESRSGKVAGPKWHGFMCATVL